MTGGTIVLFDRKMLRNFRKDGHNWKKKKDGKTVKEAHEHLKVSVLFYWELFHNNKKKSWWRPQICFHSLRIHFSDSISCLLATSHYQITIRVHT